MKRVFVLVMTIAVACLSTSAKAAGIPTFDAASVLQLQQQLQQLQRQFELLKQQNAAITGTYGRGQTGLTESIQAASVVPGSWQEVVAQQAKGAFGNRQTYYENLLRTLPAEIFQETNGRSATSYKLSSDAVRAALSGGDVLYSEVQVHLNTLSRLSQQVDNTSNLKDAQDLQNRISTENGILQSAMAKLNTLNLNLQANTLNQQTQATAATQRYFTRSKTP